MTVLSGENMDLSDFPFLFPFYFYSCFFVVSDHLHEDEAFTTSDPLQLTLCSACSVAAWGMLL